MEIMTTSDLQDLKQEIDAGKWMVSGFYKEALDNIVLYNKRLSHDRRSRLPYIDSQTGLIQKDCHLWRQENERLPGELRGQIYSYPQRRWRLESPDIPAPQASSSSKGTWGGERQAVGCYRYVT
jgi:hypothetical protein